MGVLTRMGPLALLLVLVWQGWKHLGPQKPELAEERQALVERLVPTIVEALRARPRPPEVALLHFVNDPSDAFTENLRRALQRSGVLDIQDRTFGEKLRGLLNLRQPGFGSLEEARREAKRRGAQSVLFGTIHTFETVPGGARIDVEVHMADVASGRMLFTKRYVENYSPVLLGSAAVHERVKRMASAERFLTWILTALLLPVLTIGFIRAMVRRESNAANAFTLALYTLIDAILAYLLIGAAFTSWVSVTVFLTAVAGAFLYNLYVMSFALRLET